MSRSLPASLAALALFGLAVPSVAGCDGDDDISEPSDGGSSSSGQSSSSSSSSSGGSSSGDAGKDGGSTSSSSSSGSSSGDSGTDGGSSSGDSGTDGGETIVITRKQIPAGGVFEFSDYDVIGFATPEAVHLKASVGTCEALVFAGDLALGEGDVPGSIHVSGGQLSEPVSVGLETPANKQGYYAGFNENDPGTFYDVVAGTSSLTISGDPGFLPAFANLELPTPAWPTTPIPATGQPGETLTLDAPLAASWDASPYSATTMTLSMNNFSPTSAAKIGFIKCAFPFSDGHGEIPAELIRAFSAEVGASATTYGDVRLMVGSIVTHVGAHGEVIILHSTPLGPNVDGAATSWGGQLSSTLPGNAP